MAHHRPQRRRRRWRDLVDDASILARTLFRVLLALGALGGLAAIVYYALTVRAEDQVDDNAGVDAAPADPAELAQVVPVVAGVPEDQAVARVENAGFRAVVGREFDLAVDRGTVVTSDPPAGASIELGSTVSLVVSRGSEPVCVGSTERGVRRQLEERELTVIGVSQAPSDTIEAALVVQCVIDDESDTAILVVSSGPRDEDEQNGLSAGSGGG